MANRKSPSASNPEPGSAPHRSHDDRARVVSIDQRNRLEDPGDRRRGFTEKESKEMLRTEAGGLSQEDPEHELRGEDQLVDGESVLDPVAAGEGSSGLPLEEE